jgi:DNA-binding beta-propeller fold protein YncE
LPDAPSGTAQQVAFSPDQAQKIMFVGNEHNEQVTILDHASGQIIGSFGRVGHQPGGFGHIHSIAMDSKGNIYTGEVNWGKRVQKFKIVGTQ